MTRTPDTSLLTPGEVARLFRVDDLDGDAPGRSCMECGRPSTRLKHKRCGACYMRIRRGTSGPAKPWTVDPELQRLTLQVSGSSDTFATRVFSSIDVRGVCWEWTGTLDPAGYGVLGRGQRGAGNIAAHRAAYELLAGSIPDGMHLDHLCRNHPCVNPDHLEVVTPEENKRRGYGIARLYAMRTHCNHGHPLDGVTKVSKSGRQVRYCKTCARERARARYRESSVKALLQGQPMNDHARGGSEQ